MIEESETIVTPANMPALTYRDSRSASKASGSVTVIPNQNRIPAVSDKTKPDANEFQYCVNTTYESKAPTKRKKEEAIEASTTDFQDDFVPA